MQKHINIKAEIGSPAADCKYFGICSTELLSDQDWASFVPTRVRQTKAILSITSAHQLLFSFPVSGMLPETKETFFSALGFKVDTPYFLPAFALEAFNLPPGSCIQMGIHKIKADGDFMNIKFELVLDSRLEVSTVARRAGR
jgi:hypothetical protein